MGIPGCAIWDFRNLGDQHAVVREVCKGDAWAARGCEVATADINDAAALTAAFDGAEGVFVLVPPNFDPSPGFPEARATAATLSRRSKGPVRPDGSALTSPGEWAKSANTETLAEN
jgi:uncharacterized protein YbjT (DUF2867 family)